MMQLDGKCGYIVSGVQGKPGWWGVFRNVEMRDIPQLRGMLYQFSAWSGKEFIQVEGLEPIENQNCWPSTSEALAVLSGIIGKAVAA